MIFNFSYTNLLPTLEFYDRNLPLHLSSKGFGFFISLTPTSPPVVVVQGQYTNDQSQIVAWVADFSNFSFTSPAPINLYQEITNLNNTNSGGIVASLTSDKTSFQNLIFGDNIQIKYALVWQDWTYAFDSGLSTFGITGFTTQPAINNIVMIPSVHNTTTNMGNVVSIVPPGKGNFPFSSSNLSLFFEVPNYLQSIGNLTFSGLTNFVGDLLLPESLISVGDNAFQGCSGFNGAFLLSPNIQTIGLNAFKQCSNLVGSVTLPNTLTSIGDYAFYQCQRLNGNLILSSNTNFQSISNFAFDSCSNLIGNLFIPNNIVNVFEHAFYQCSNLNGNLHMSTSVENIGANAFEFCSKLSGNLSLPNTLNFLNFNAFYGCQSLSNLVFDPDMPLTEISCSAFQLCSNLSGNLVIPNNVAIIGDYAFASCNSLNALELNSNLTRIGIGSFLACSNLANDLVIPNSVTVVKSGAFDSCSNLHSVTLSANLINIEAATFVQCSNLTGTLEIPSEVKNIDFQAFAGCRSLNALILPSNIETIIDLAFLECSNLSGNLVIPNSVTFLGDNAFGNCSSLSGLVLSSNISVVNQDCFINCSNLTGNLTIPDKVENIEGSAFKNCSNISNLLLGSNLLVISNSAFENCQGISNINFHNSSNLTTIGPLAFSNTNIKSQVKLPNSLTTIGIAAFPNDATLSLEFDSSSRSMFYLPIDGLPSSNLYLTTSSPAPVGVVFNPLTNELTVSSSVGSISLTIEQNPITTITFISGMTPPCLMSPCVIECGNDLVPKDISEIQPGEFVLSSITKKLTKVLEVRKTTVKLPLPSLENMPYLIPKDYFALNVPSMDTKISGNHQIIFQDASGQFVGIHTNKIFPDHYRLDLDSNEVVYYHIKLESGKDAFFANDLAVESFIDY